MDMWGALLGLGALYPQIFDEGNNMAIDNISNAFIGYDFGAQQSNVGGLVGGQAGHGHSHSIYDPGHHHGIDPYAAHWNGMNGMNSMSEMARRQQEMQKVQAMREMDRLRGANDMRLQRPPDTLDDLGRYLEEHPGCDAPRYQPISQPAPSKVLLLLE